MQALLIGAGRMGLTHLALFNLLSNFSIEWTIVEPSRLMRLGISRALPRRMVRKCVATFHELNGRYDFAVVCSPTPHHQACYDFAEPRSGKLFMEKPLRVAKPNNRTLCGYVMLHHPLHQKFADLIAGQHIGAFEISLQANTVLGPNEGWRGHSDQGGGVINEFGSHLFSILVDLIGPVADCRIEEIASPHSSNAPDKAVISGHSNSGIPFVARLDWSDPTVRKPLYRVSAKSLNIEISHDFYELRDGVSVISIADLPSAAGSYLRGLEFSAQARYFLNNDTFVKDAALACEVDRILEHLQC